MGKLNDIQKLELVNDYRSGVDLNQLSLKYGIHRTSVRGLLKRRGETLKNGSESRRRYNINENFFDEFNKNNMYFLGLLYADGYHNEKRKNIRLALKEDDEELLIKVRDLIGSDRPIGIDSSRGENYKQKYLDINNLKISKRLVELGCVQNKTFKIIFPDFIPNNLMSHFIRGYFDGDGGLTKYKIFDKKNNKEIIKQKITFRGTKNFCENLKIFLSDNLNTGGYISNEKTPCLSYSGKKDIIKIMDYLYSDAFIYLERKYEKFKTIKNDER
jgi:hypothetical protein